MEFPLQRSKGGADAGRRCGCSGLRLFTVPRTRPPRRPRPSWAANGALRRRERGRVLGGRRSISRASCTARWASRSASFRRRWGGTPAEAWTPREALRAEPTLAPMVDALDARRATPRGTTSWRKKLAAWEAKNFHQDRRQPRREGRLGARRGRQAGTTMEIPQLWESRGPGDRRRRLVPARGDGPRRRGRRRADAVAGRGRRLRRHLLERRARRRHRRGDAAVLRRRRGTTRSRAGW